MYEEEGEGEVGRKHQEMDWPTVRQVPEGSREQGKMEKTGFKIICGAPATLAVKGLMMMMTTASQGESVVFGVQDLSTSDFRAWM